MNIAVVIPVYLDTDALPELLDRLFLTCARQGHDAEVILIDDGSGNETWQRLIDIKHANASRRIVLLRLAKNYGQQAATICGLIHCNAEIAITMDSDLQHPPEEIPALLQELARRRCDVVYGIPAQSRHSLWRRTSSLAFRTLTQPIGSSAAMSSSFRAIRTALTAGLREAIRKRHLSLDAFLQKKTDRISTIKVDHAARRHGSSTYTWWTLLVTAIKELHYSRSSAAIYMASGALAVFLGGFSALQEGNSTIAIEWAVSCADTLTLAGGLALFFWGAHHFRTGGRPSRTPLFEIAGKME